MPASRYLYSWAASGYAQRNVSVDGAQRVYVPLASAPGDARRGIAPGWVRLNGYTGARDITWGVNGFLALPKSSRDYESAGPVIQVSSSNALTGATLVHSGSATGAVIQRRWSR